MTPLMVVGTKAESRDSAQDIATLPPGRRLTATPIVEYGLYEYPTAAVMRARTKCGICTLMQEPGLYDLTPAMCHLAYAPAQRRRDLCGSIGIGSLPPKKRV